jgi:hypothetical protein
MKRLNTAVLVAGASLLGWAGVAAAGPVVTINNTTEVETYTGTTASNGFFGGGDYWGANIGAPIFNTPTATISFVGNTVDIKFTTGLYQGVDNSFNPTVYGADVFLKSGGGAALPVPGTSFFNYGIALGFDAADGGHATAGLYSIPVTSTDGTTYKGSTDIWGTRSSDTYGGAYAAAGCTLTSSTCAGSQASPTVLTGGALVNGISVSTASTAPVGSSTTGSLDVLLTATGTGATLAANLATLSGLFSNFDIFWGTGDCSNAPIWGNVAGLTRVPEPSSLALLATAAIGLRIMRRRKRKAPAVG